MKSLNHYTDKATTELFNSTGSFFAFGQKQFDECKQDGIKYSSLGAGLITPSSNVKAVIDGLDNITNEGIEARLKEYGMNRIIQYELGNHECQISGEIDEVVSVMASYGATEKQVQEQYKLFYRKCCDNDWF